MQPLNAIDAITPAFARANEILFQPFHIGRSWKLAASQYVGLVGAVFVPMPLMLVFLPNFSQLPGALRPVAAVALAVGTLIFFGFFYLGLRMQFVNFEMIVTRATFIGPMWRRYGSRVWPVIVFKTILGTVLSLAMAPFLWKSMASLMQMMINMPRITPGQPPDFALLQSMYLQIFGLEATFFAAFLFIKLICTAFEDFVQPFYILEDIPLTAALSRGAAVFAADPLHCILYLVLKLILSVVGFIAQYISMLILMIPTVIVIVILVLGGTFIFGAMGAAGHLLGLAAAIVLYLVLIAGMLWYQVGTLGYLSMLLEAYAVYFLGGRYPLLGAMLESGPGGPFTPPPVFPSSEERNHHDDGPPMPMNPAVA